MKRGKLFGIFAMLLLVTLVSGQSGRAQTAQPDLSRLTGVWRGQADGFPAVTLVVTDESGSLMGAVLFYFHMRKTVNDPVTSTPGLPEPMFGMNFDGKMLTFQVSHRRAHPPRTLSDPPVTLTLTLTGPNQAELVNKSERSPALTVVRSDY
jgi:hypothetical protein